MLFTSKNTQKLVEITSILGLGYKVPVQCCDVSCIGEGPVVSTEPTKLDWGEVPVLRKHTLTLELINDSPIPAEYKASMVSLRKSSHFFSRLSIFGKM